jgi:hypothetical protein
VEKSEEESENGMKYVWNELKPWGAKFEFFVIFLDF